MIKSDIVAEKSDIQTIKTDIETSFNSKNEEHTNNMKTIRVVAAVIKSVNKTNEPIILATQRGYGEYKGGWEFPGGKIEEGESPEHAIVREIKEELDADIEVGALIDTIEYDYPAFHLSMDCFWAKLKGDHLTLLEHEDAKWLRKEELNSVEWLPADITLIEKIAKEI